MVTWQMTDRPAKIAKTIPVKVYMLLCHCCQVLQVSLGGYVCIRSTMAPEYIHTIPSVCLVHKGKACFGESHGPCTTTPTRTTRVTVF